MTNKEYLSIGEAAEYLGVSEQTLRRWDGEGAFKASFVSPGGHRKYSLADLTRFAKGLFQLAKEWASALNPPAPPDEFYCAYSNIFKARLDRLAREMETRDTLKNIGPIVISIVGEIGNNSFDHNLGNWPDAPGIFFAYDLGKRVVALADRGVGVLATLRRIRPALADDKEALRVAFTEIISGRMPEHRGNGLKFVKSAVLKYKLRLLFQSGNEELELNEGREEFKMRPATISIRGCLALLEF